MRCGYSASLMRPGIKFSPGYAARRGTSVVHLTPHEVLDGHAFGLVPVGAGGRSKHWAYGESTPDERPGPAFRGLLNLLLGTSAGIERRRADRPMLVLILTFAKSAAREGNANVRIDH